MQSSVELFGVEINTVSFDEAVQTVLAWIADEAHACRYLITPNINHLVMYQDNQRFREAYADASLVLPDGRYVILLSRMLGCPLAEPVNGSDLVPAVLEAAKDCEKSVSIFLLGAMPGVADRAAAKIVEEWPWIEIVGTYSPPLGFETDAEVQKKMLTLVNSRSPEILILGISPPKQEIWMLNNADGLNARVAICAGATIDFLAGEKSRAPSWMQRAGLEWVYRTMTEPRRLIPRYFGDGIAMLKLLLVELRKKAD